MQVAVAEKVGEAVADVLAFARANPGQTALNKLTVYQAAKELGSDFRMARRYYRKARRRFRAYRRRFAGRKRVAKRSVRPRKRMRKSYRKRMQPHAAIGKSAKDQGLLQQLTFGVQNVQSWRIGTGSTTLIEPGARLRPWTWVNGMRVCVRIQNVQETRMLEYHWCLVQEREPSNGSPKNGINTLTKDWWRDNRGGEVDTFTDFDDGSPVTNWSPFLSCGRIATSRYKVITHQKALLGGAPDLISSSLGFKGTSHFYHCEKYIKMKKKVLFNGITDVTGRYPVYFVDWITMPCYVGYPGASTVGAERFVELTTYYDAF